MGPLAYSVVTKWLDVMGFMRRCEFWVSTILFALIQLPILIVLLSATSSELAFSIAFQLALYVELFLSVALFSAMTRRVRDAGGASWIPAGFYFAAILVMLGSISQRAELGWSALERPGILGTLALWSCVGFGGCLLILLTLPSSTGDQVLFDEATAPAP
jgi:uncharacterized membrane protein YhaH (DUF805 family)